MKVENLVNYGGDWNEIRKGFRWPKPDVYNIAEQICERWARSEPDRVALTCLAADGAAADYTYGQLSRDSSRLANVFAENGLNRGDRCAVLLPQTYETVLTHLACYKLGAIVVPLFTLFGKDGLKYRLGNSGAKMLVTDAANLPKVEGIIAGLPELQKVWSIDGGGLDFWEAVRAASDHIVIAKTTLMDPAFISYTSGTTGPPKGALHGHKVLLGHMPGVEMHHNFLPQSGDKLWTPADWAWMGGLTNVMMPALNYGVHLVAHRMPKFDPVAAFQLMRVHEVRNAFLPPTALKLMRQVSVEPLDMRSVGSGGESLGADMLAWGEKVFGLTINEFYGQTECNLVLGNCSAVFAAKPGSMGRATPGAEVAILDGSGRQVPDGEMGEIAVKRGAAQMFLGYWQEPEKTAAKFSGDWLRTGDLAYQDAEGYFHFSARDDDVITSSGYRIGPSEIEDCLTGHKNVALAAVIGVPDPVRTEIVKAFVVLDGVPGSEALMAELITRVRSRISPHVAPREIAFVDSLPMTATGKIMRRELRK